VCPGALYALRWPRTSQSTPEYPRAQSDFHDESTSHQHVLWKDLPDQDEGLTKFLNRILWHSCNFMKRMPIAGHHSGDASSAFSCISSVTGSPTVHDYLLWQVHCQVSLYNWLDDENLPIFR
jgi:hypothetical protein